ncbi:2464_t:CDS:2 [Entrophospora sp. SA101]|nr:2464_t:CDS:2 [Entrophospora sp. SA101]
MSKSRVLNLQTYSTNLIGKVRPMNHEPRKLKLVMKEENGTGQSLDSEVANKVQTILNNHFRNNTINNKPSFIGDIEISDLDFGTIPPLIEVIDITDPFPEFYLSDSATTVEVESGTDSVESQSLNTTDTQIHVAISYKGDMKMTITTELFMNYPSMRFMSLPIRLNVTGFEFSATAVVAFFKNRVNFCFLESKNPEESPLKDVHIESEIGDKEKQVLKNVGKLEKFIVNQLRKLIEEDFVFPSYHSIDLQPTQ